MAAVLFDTHEAVKELQDAGVAPAMAEAVVRTVRRGLGENVATKHDIAELRTELQAEIAELRTELKAEITELRTELKADIAALDTRITETKAELKAEIASQEARLTWRLLGGIALLLTIHLALLKLL